MSLKVVNIFTFDLSIRVNSFVSWFYFLFLFVNSNLKQYHNSSFSIFLLVLFWTKYADYLCAYVKLSMIFCHRQIPGRKSSRCHNLLIDWNLLYLFFSQYSRLVYTPGHIQADEGEEEVDNEHLKRYISTRRSLDPVFTLPLPTYFRNQVKYRSESN
jgi:hypothetical protein